jgi:hypothetical protein
LETKLEVAKAADPPTTLASATTTCKPICKGSCSGTTYTQTGPRANKNKLNPKRLLGVPGSVAAERMPSSSALDKRPSLSTVESEKPRFSAAERRPAFSALLRRRSFSTFVSSLIGCALLLLSSRGPGSPIGKTVVPCQVRTVCETIIFVTYVECITELPQKKSTKSRKTRVL